MEDSIQPFSWGFFLGAVAALIVNVAVRTPQSEVYQRGVMDCQQGNLRPVIHIEDGDTTITYKMD